MEKSEPSLVPEWLRNSGNGGAAHHFTPSQSSDGLLLALPNRNNASKNFGKSDRIRPFLDQSSSSNRRISSSNGSVNQEKNQYYRSFSSFTRGQRDKGRGSLTIDDNWDTDYSDPLRSIMSNRIEKDTLRRSQSMVSRKQSEVVHGLAYTDLRRTGQGTSDNGNSRLSVGGMEKVSFERDFPSLGSEERPVTPDIGRIPSPGLTRSMQGLSIGNSSLIGGEGWTSALAEVPVGVGGNTNASTSHLPAVASSSSATYNSTPCLNMAAALVQAPSKSQIAQQPSVQDQKREELAIIQSMKLIPMTLSMPKNTVHNPSDKLKPKTAVRSGDQLAASKNGQPSMQLGAQLVRGTNVKADAPKTSHTGKLLVLKPGRENGVSLPLRDTSSSTGSVASSVVNGHHASAPISASVAFKNSGNPKLSASTKTSAFVPKTGSVLDNKPTSAKAQSRSDFFKLMRKKSSNSSAHAESSTIVSSISEKSDEFDTGANASLSPGKDDDEVKCNGDAFTMSRGLSEISDYNFSNGSATLPDEEEAAFLRSLGWEENAGDDEGLTEEEINSFYQEYMKLRPASKLGQGLQLKMLGEAEPPATCSGGPSLEFGKSDSSA